MIHLYPRLVGFDINGLAVSAGFGANTYDAFAHTVMQLPSDHYDYIGPIKVEGKTRTQIENEVSEMMELCS